MRRRRERYRPTKDWRDPDMPVTRSWFEGMGRRVTREVSPGESTELSAEGMTADLPSWRVDPSYFWARDARKRRGKH